MLTAFEQAASTWPRDAVHVEYFTAKDAPDRSGGFTVELAKSNRRFEVPEGSTILDVLLENGIVPRFQCTEGVCGECETAVIEGVPEHRDSYLTDDERTGNKTMMICCSGCKGAKLVLNL